MTENYQLERTLWAIMDQFRNNMIVVDYKHMVFGLILLKYLSDTFRDSASREPDQNTDEHVFIVPPQACWESLLEGTDISNIGKRLDEAMIAIEKENPSLKGVMFKEYERIASQEIYDLISSLSMDNYGENVYTFAFEYLLRQFAELEGGSRGEFYTPECIAKLLVELLAPEVEKSLYDGCCGSGGLFVQSQRFIEMYETNKGKMSFYGQENDPSICQIAKMHLIIKNMDANIKLGNTLTNDKFPELKVDYILSTPPFNANGSDVNKADTQKWKYGVPPTGNANYAWLQHYLSKLAPTGATGIVLANTSLSSNLTAERKIRKGLIEDDLVDSIVALPSQLFYKTQIPVCLWILSLDKTNNQFRARSNEVLFIDAREMGAMKSRKQRELSDQDIQKITQIYHTWRDKDKHDQYKNIPGFCRVVSLQEIRDSDYILTPIRYVGIKKTEEDEQAFDEKMKWLTGQLREQMDVSVELDAKIKANLKKVGYSI